MSTKIYTAWRMPVRHLGDVFLPAYRDYYLRKAAARVRAEAKLVTEDTVATMRARARAVLNEKSDQFFRVRAVLENAGHASVQRTRNPTYDLDTSLNVWLRGGKAYAIPYGELNSVYGQLDKTPVFDGAGAEEYGYWDNTDRSDGVSASAWARRKKNWEPVLEDWNAGRLVYTVLDVKRRIGVFDLVGLVLPRERNNPWRVVLGLEHVDCQ